MKVLVLSDLHLELGSPLVLPPRLEYDAVVLAGDIHSPGHKAVHWAQRVSVFGGKPVVFVPGNHEFYGCTIDVELLEMLRVSAGSNVHLLHRGDVVIGGVRFIGCTLWTDFQLGVRQSDGTTASNIGQSLLEASRCMNDFRLIEVQAPAVRQQRGRTLRRLLRPEDTLAMHWIDRDWLRRALEEPFDGPTVVVTHHAPSRGSVAERYAADWVTPAFVSDLPSTFFKVPVLWVHGHTHSPFDYQQGACRVVSNPRGYRMRDGSFENTLFNAGFIVELPADSRLAPMEGLPLVGEDFRHGLDHYDELVPGRHEASLAERKDMVALEEAARLVGGTVLAAVTIGRLRTWSALRHPRVIAFSHPRLGLRFPQWQFEPRIWPVVQRLAAALQATGGMEMLSWLETPHGALDGRTPRAALEQGELADRVLGLATAEGL